VSYQANFKVWRGNAEGGDLQDFTVEVNEGEVVLEQFGDFRVVRTSDGTVLSGDLDQAALHGLLERIRASGLELVDVRRPRGRREPRPS
jgi:hypothetical protein